VEPHEQGGRLVDGAEVTRSRLATDRVDRTAFVEHKPGPGPAERAGHGHDVPHASTRAQHRRTPLEVSERRERNDDHCRRGGRQVATHDRTTRVLGSDGDAAGEVENPVELGLGVCGQGDEQPRRRRPHGGDVRDVLGDHLDPDVVCSRPVVAPVASANHRVGRDDDGLAGRDDGSVVTGRDQHASACRRALAEQGDDAREQIGLAHGADRRVHGHAPTS